MYTQSHWKRDTVTEKITNSHTVLYTATLKTLPSLHSHTDIAKCTYLVTQKVIYSHNDNNKYGQTDSVMHSYTENATMSTLSH